jgi:hypothetical protein
MSLRLLLASSALVASASLASAQEVNILGWGGAYTQSQVEAYHQPLKRTRAPGSKLQWQRFFR